MHDLTILRLYFTAARTRQADRWWNKLAPQSLGDFLLRSAKQGGIEQALLHRVIGGYLKGHELAMDTGEIAPARLPQCLELVGPEDMLRQFLHGNRQHLRGVRIVFLRGEEARVEAALERQELEHVLEMENRAKP